MTRPSLLLLPLLILLALTPLSLCMPYRASTCNGSLTDKDKLYIQGFVPASGDVFTSETVVPAATVACQEINDDDSILSDYELVIEWSNTEVQMYMYTCISH